MDGRSSLAGNEVPEQLTDAKPVAGASPRLVCPVSPVVHSLITD